MIGCFRFSGGTPGNADRLTPIKGIVSGLWSLKMVGVAF
jgi:hypothetical protein